MSKGPKQRAPKNTTRPKKRRTKPIEIKVSKIYKPDNLELEEWQRLLRKQFAAQQAFKLKNIGGHPIFSEFMLTNQQSGKNYKVAIRGLEPGRNYCSCPDYSINNLGTCKHIEFTLLQLLKRKGAKKAFKDGFSQLYSEIYLRYGTKREIIFLSSFSILVTDVLSSRRLKSRGSSDNFVITSGEVESFSAIYLMSTGLGGLWQKFFNEWHDFINYPPGG